MAWRVLSSQHSDNPTGLMTGESGFDTPGTAQGPLITLGTRGMKLNSPLYSLPTIIRGAIHPLPHTPSCCDIELSAATTLRVSYLI
jgi:hypothetical protein